MIWTRDMEDAGDGLMTQINRARRSQQVHTRDGECRRKLWEVNADGGEARDGGCPEHSQDSGSPCSRWARTALS